MKVVWKYKLELIPWPERDTDAPHLSPPPAGYNELLLPEGRAVYFDYMLSSPQQGSEGNGEFYMWYEVDNVAQAHDTSRHRTKKFMIVATGENFKFNYTHVGTCIIPSPSFTTVWHLYEKQE